MKKNMHNKADSLFSVIARKGIAETFLNVLFVLVNRLESSLKVLVLNFRGYKVAGTVVFRGNTQFFQSYKNSITILGNCVIGRNTRITTGDRGKLIIKENVHIDDYTFIMAHDKIEIGKNTTIAPFCFIIDFNHESKQSGLSVMQQGTTSNSIKIGSGVWIGTHSVILPGVKIGDGAVIGAGSIVTHDIPSRSIAVGNPAKIVKRVGDKK